MKNLLATIDLYDDDTPAMARGGRIGFYKGEKVVKSHGKQIKDLTEAGESSVSIAKKLRLKQQTVNAAMDAMDKGIAGEEFKLKHQIGLELFIVKTLVEINMRLCVV